MTRNHLTAKIKVQRQQQRKKHDHETNEIRDQRPHLRNDRGGSDRSPRRTRRKDVLLLQRPLSAKVSIRARRGEARGKAGRLLWVTPVARNQFANRSFAIEKEINKEKTVMNAKTLSIILLGVGLSAVQARAISPRSHRLHGIVQSVDVSAHSFVVQKSIKTQPLIIQWNGRTRFRDGKEPAEPENLKAGQVVCVSYRVRPGRLVASRVDVRHAPGVRENGSAKGGAIDLMKH